MQQKSKQLPKGSCFFVRRMTVLIIPIKKKWFKMLCSGEKTEDYREIKPYWIQRFGWQDKVFPDDSPEHPHRLVVTSITMPVIFRNGYNSDSPYLKCFVHITKGFGRSEWGAKPKTKYFVLRIDKVLEKKTT